MVQLQMQPGANPGIANLTQYGSTGGNGTGSPESQGGGGGAGGNGVDGNVGSSGPAGQGAPGGPGTGLHHHLVLQVVKFLLLEFIHCLDLEQ